MSGYLSTSALAAMSEEALGGVLSALHMNRASARNRAKLAKADFDKAVVEERHMGHYEDCGSFYVSMMDQARGALDEAVRNKISAERQYKKVREILAEKRANKGALHV